VDFAKTGIVRYPGYQTSYHNRGSYASVAWKATKQFGRIATKCSGALVPNEDDSSRYRRSW
jgi:hypothetical protein